MTQKSKIILISFLLVGIFTAQFAFAQGLVECAAGKNNCTLQDLLFVVIKIINFLIGAAWLVAVGFIFWGSYGLATAYGNSEKIEAGKGIVQKAVVGFFLIMIAFLLINWLVLALGGYTFQEMMQYLFTP